MLPSPLPPPWWYVLRGVWSVAWISAATYELLILFFGTDRSALLTPLVLGVITSYGSLSFAVGALIARLAIPYHEWEPWPPPPWWGFAIVAGTFVGLVLLDFSGPRNVPFAASGAFGTIVGHLFIAKCVDEPTGKLTDCEDPPRASEAPADRAG